MRPLWGKKKLSGMADPAIGVSVGQLEQMKLKGLKNSTVLGAE